MTNRAAFGKSLRFILHDIVVPLFFGWALFRLFSSALGSENSTHAKIYWLLAWVTTLGFMIAVWPALAKRIGKETVRRFAFRFCPNSRFARPPLSYTRARQFTAEKKYAEAIAEFQEILRHYPQEKEPYSQIIWMANLTGQTEIAETYSRILQERFG
jgi:TolA-binding protein